MDKELSLFLFHPVETDRVCDTLLTITQFCAILEDHVILPSL